MIAPRAGGCVWLLAVFGLVACASPSRPMSPTPLPTLSRSAAGCFIGPTQATAFLTSEANRFAFEFDMSLPPWYEGPSPVMQAAQAWKDLLQDRAGFVRNLDEEMAPRYCADRAGRALLAALDKRIEFLERYGRGQSVEQTRRELTALDDQFTVALQDIGTPPQAAPAAVVAPTFAVAVAPMPMPATATVTASPPPARPTELPEIVEDAAPSPAITPSDTPAPTETPAPIDTPAPTETPQPPTRPSDTPRPTRTATATRTARPSDTPRPSVTPAPVFATPRPVPSRTATPEPACASLAGVLVPGTYFDVVEATVGPRGSQGWVATGTVHNNCDRPLRAVVQAEALGRGGYVLATRRVTLDAVDAGAQASFEIVIGSMTGVVQGRVTAGRE
jgi:hypothetical protein